MSVETLILPARARRLPGIPAAGLLIVAALLIAAAAADRVAPYDPRTASGQPLLGPAPAHPLGTNDLGQDLLSLWLHGARTSLGVGFVAAALSTVLSATAGTLSVLWRPATAPVLLVIDGLIALPHLPLIVLVVALLGPGPLHLITVLAALGWPAYARVVRTQVLRSVQRDYVEAARAAGAQHWRVLRTCIIPELLPILWTKFLLTVRWAILMEATLALLGLGDPTRASWGTVLATAWAYPMLFVGRAWIWWALPPALSIAALTLGLAALGQDFETWLNPAARHAARQVVSLQDS